MAATTGVGTSPLGGGVPAGGRFTHAGVLPGSCSTCHNGQAAPGKPGRHLQTTLSCDACHRTTSWLPAIYTHQGAVPGTCGTCHNGQGATGKPAAHFVTTRSCDQCHRTTAWLPIKMYQHISPAYVFHGPRLMCSSCHTNRLEVVPYKFAVYRPACAACHANQFPPNLHLKVENPPLPYTPLELKDCSGACHVYTSSKMLNIKTMRVGRHHATDGGF